MTCNHCKKYYIGESGQTINLRFRAHESHARHGSNNPISTHFNENNLTEHSYTVTIVDREPLKNERLRKEEAWIHLLNSFEPNGFNRKL